MSYVKISPSILNSTVWSESIATKMVWLTMMIMADRDGLVEARAPGIAIRAGVPIDETRKALAIFSAPDPDSRSQEYEGRRAKETSDGWLILNFEKYRDMGNQEDRDEKARKRAQRTRDRAKAKAELEAEENRTPCNVVCKKNTGCKQCATKEGI